MSNKDYSHIIDEQVERFLLASLFIEPDKIVEIADKFEAKFFKFEPHQHIYECIYSLYENKLAVDSNTVWLSICKKGLQSNILQQGDVKFLEEGAGCIIAGNGAKNYASEIVDRYARREYSKILTKQLEILNSKAVDLDKIKEMSTQIISTISNITSREAAIVKVDFSADSIMQEMRDKLDKNTITGHTTGIKELDQLMDGIQKRRVTTFVGDSSSGKTQLGSIQIAVENALLGKSVFIGSFEMDEKELSTRMAFYLTGLSSTSINNPKTFIENGIRSGKFKNKEEAIDFVSDKMKQAEVIIKKLPIHIYENEDVTIDDFRNAIYKHIMQVGVPDLIVCDHAELLVQDRRDLITELYKIYRKSKGLAKKLNCAFIMLHQYSNEMKNSKDKYPDIYAIMGGSAVRHNSDAILMIYNPSIYQSLINEKPELKDVFDIIIGKARYFNKGEGIVNCKFNGIKVIDKVQAYADRE